MDGGPGVAEVDEAKKENTPAIADHTGSGLVAGRLTGSDLQRAAEEAEAPKESESSSPASQAAPAATIDLDILHNSMEDIVANQIMSTLDANRSR